MEHRVTADTRLKRLRGEREDGTPVTFVPVLVTRSDLVDFVLPHPRPTPWHLRIGEVDPAWSRAGLHAILKQERRLAPREADLEVGVLVVLRHVAVATFRHRVVAPLVDALEHTGRVSRVRGRPVVAHREWIVPQAPACVAGRRGIGWVEHSRRAEAI